MAEATGSVWRRVERARDYIFGRNALIGFASLMLLAISGFATWSGMSDFIIGVSQTPGSAGRDIGGGLSVTNEMLVIAIVVALTFLMWLSLRECFGAKRSMKDRLITFPLYLFLFLWSVGFGYGFWWSLIAGEEATRSSLSNLQEDAGDASSAISARLDAVRIQLDSVVSWSDSQMAREETSGGSCGVPSGSGRGPLYNARRSVRDSITSLRDGIGKSWLGPVQTDIEELKKTASGPEGVTVEERQKKFEAQAAGIRARARSIAGRSNELGKSTSAEMSALAAVVSIAPGKAGFSCFDPTLAQRLRQAASQAGEPAVLRLREASFNEGPAGVANAVKTLWANLGDYVAYPFQYVITGGKPPIDPNARAMTGRDLIALLATIGIDLGLFALTALNPPPPAPMSTEFKGRVRKAIDTAIGRAPGTSRDWLHLHLIHHNDKAYFVIPNLYRCGEVPERYRREAEKAEVERSEQEHDEAALELMPGEERRMLADEKARGLAMNQVAGVLHTLGLIKLLKPKDLKWFVEEEKRESLTDLDPLRHRHRDDKPEVRGLRNHGLLSKARRALDVGGWNAPARRDVEIFEVLDKDGITPLLTILYEDAGETLLRDQAVPRYLKELIEETGSDPLAYGAIDRIMTQVTDVKLAISDIGGRNSDLSKAIMTSGTEIAGRIREAHVAIEKKWKGDPDITYHMSRIDTDKLQLGVVIYHALRTIEDVALKDGKNAAPAAKISGFLAGGGSVPDLIKVLNSIG